MPFLATVGLLLSAQGGAASDFVHASFPPSTRVLFQGDSITDAGRDRDGKDPNNQLGHSYAFYVGAAPAATQGGVTFFNRGISGNKVTDLLGRWQDDTIKLKPDVLSILIGINDLNGGVSAADYEAQYDRLLAQTVAALPNVKLLILEPFSLPTGGKKEGFDQFSVKLAERQDIAHKLARKYNAVFLRVQLLFDWACLHQPAETWIGDGIHPTEDGQRLIADEWIRMANAAYGAK